MAPRSEPRAVVVARERLAAAGARQREAPAARTHAEAEHRRLATRCVSICTTPGAPARPSTASTSTASRSPAPPNTPRKHAPYRSGRTGHHDAEHAVTQALIKHADEMRRVLDEASDKLTAEHADLQAAAAVFTAHRDQTRARWEEYIRANEPDGPVKGWHRDAMRGDLLLEPAASFRPRRAGSSGVLTSARPGPTPDAVAGFLND